MSVCILTVFIIMVLLVPYYSTCLRCHKLESSLPSSHASHPVPQQSCQLWLQITSRIWPLLIISIATILSKPPSCAMWISVCMPAQYWKTKQNKKCNWFIRNVICGRDSIYLPVILSHLFFISNWALVLFKTATCSAKSLLLPTTLAAR